MASNGNLIRFIVCVVAYDQLGFADHKSPLPLFGILRLLIVQNLPHLRMYPLATVSGSDLRTVMLSGPVNGSF